MAYRATLTQNGHSISGTTSRMTAKKGRIERRTPPTGPHSRPVGLANATDSSGVNAMEGYIDCNSCGLGSIPSHSRVTDQNIYSVASKNADQRQSYVSALGVHLDAHAVPFGPLVAFLMYVRARHGALCSLCGLADSVIPLTVQPRGGTATSALPQTGTARRTRRATFHFLPRQYGHHLLGFHQCERRTYWRCVVVDSVIVPWLTYRSTAGRHWTSLNEAPHNILPED